MSKEARKGNSFEQAVADFMAERLRDDRIERRQKNGKNDRGDITGVRIRGRRVVLECKNCARTELAEWWKEAERERGNDDADFAFVVHHRKGCGEAQMGRQYVTCDLDTLCALIAGGRDCL